MKNVKGSFYIEVIISVFIFSVIGTYLFSSIPTLLNKSRSMVIYSKLETVSEYVASYAFRWVNYKEFSTLVSLSESNFDDGDDLEYMFGQNTNVNNLFYDVNSKINSQFISDQFKFTIKVQEISKRKQKSAGLIITVWYDENNDSRLNLNEQKIVISTIITEKGPVL